MYSHLTLDRYIVMCPPPRQLAPIGTLQCLMPCCLSSHKDIVGFNLGEEH